MALLTNTTLQPNNTSVSTPATSQNSYVSPGTPNQSVPSLSASIRTGLGNLGQFILPSATYQPYQAPITGLVSPSHPSVGSINTGSPIATHTVTTNPDNSVTSKVTYDNGGSTSSAPNNSTTSTPPSSPTLPSAPTAPLGGYTVPAGATYSTPQTPQVNNGNPYTPQLASVSAAGSPTATGYNAATAGFGAGNIPIGQTGQATGTQYAQDIQKAIAPYIGLAGGQATTGTAPVAQGNELATLQAASELGTQLSNAGNLALSGNAQALTAQSQAATATNEAAGQALGQQQTEQSGLGAAAAQAQPSGTFPFVFNPNIGTYSVSGGNLQGAISNGVQQATNNPALYTSLYNAIQSTYGDASAGMFQQAYIQAGGNPQTAGASGTAAASNVATAGTAQTSTYSTIYSTASTNAATTATLQAQIRQVGKQALSLMQSDPQINQFALQFGNRTINQLQSQLSSPQYAAFNTAIQSLQARIGQALQAGEIPTAATSNAQSIANGDITLAGLGSTLSQVDNELTAFVGTQNALANYAKGQMQTGSTGTGSNASGFNSW